MNSDQVLTDEHFKCFGYEPTTHTGVFVKQAAYGQSEVHRNEIRDGSGNYDGYILTQPESRLIRTVGDLLHRSEGKGSGR